MIAATAKLLTFLSPTRITGPIFEKELRVSSRHKRTYFLRLLFIIAITTFMAIVWMNEVDRHLFTRFNGPAFGGNQSALAIQTQMALIGKLIIVSIAWFLFYTMPVLAVILLSTSISSEIQGKTIGVLVSTPITSFQIVMGKMLSKLYQLILLMAISVPILSMVRVFGGVSWNYIISSFCVTLTFTILAGSLSLLLSIYIKKPFVVIPVVIVFLVGITAILRIELMYGMLRRQIRNEQWFLYFGFSLNPFELFRGLEQGMKYPGRAFMIKNFIWQLHCGISLLFSMIILFIASLKVRKVALMQVTGQLSPLKRWLNTESKKETPKTVKTKKTRKIRNVSDNPVIWREARSPVFVKRKFLRIAAMAVVSLGSAAVFFICVFSAIMSHGESLPVCILGFLIYASVITVIPSASCIPAEKESRSWPMLMSTSLSDRQILTGKFVGILRKCMFPWALLLLFMFYILVLGLTHLTTILFVTLIMMSIIVTLSGSGLFFGTLFRKTNAAVIANIIFAVCFWVFLPMLSDFSFFLLGDLFDFCLSMNPFRQSMIVMDLTAYNSQIYWWDSGKLGLGMTFVTIMISTLIHLSLGAFFAVLAKKRLRKNIF